MPSSSRIRYLNIHTVFQIPTYCDMHLANQVLTCLPVPPTSEILPSYPSAPRANLSHAACSSVRENLDLNCRATARPNYPDCKDLSSLDDKGVTQSPQQTENPACRCSTRDRTVWNQEFPSLQPDPRNILASTNVTRGCEMVEIFVVLVQLYSRNPGPPASW